MRNDVKFIVKSCSDGDIRTKRVDAVFSTLDDAMSFVDRELFSAVDFLYSCGDRMKLIGHVQIIEDKDPSGDLIFSCLVDDMPVLTYKIQKNQQESSQESTMMHDAAGFFNC